VIGSRHKFIRSFAAVAIVCLACTLLSCASYTTRMQDLRDTLAAGDFDAVLERVEAVSKPGELLYHLERGALLHYAGRFAESNTELSTAEELIDDLYTVSVSERALSFLLNDEAESYRGEIHEIRYLHYYRLLNYFALEQPAEATVEARRLAMKLEQQRENEFKDDPLLRDDPFLEMVAATALASADEWNSAWIASRHARWGYRDWAAIDAIPAPDWLDQNCLQYAIRTGINRSEMEEGGDFDDIAWVEAVNKTRTGQATVLILFEAGYSVQKESFHIRLPIFQDEADWDGNAGSWALGGVLAHRHHYYEQHQHWDRSDIEIAYFIDVAIPLMSPPEDRYDSWCRVSTITPALSIPSQNTVPVTDLDHLIYGAFKRDELTILTKTIARALLKYIAKEQAEKKLGSLAGLLANIAGMATEKADTRAWLTLPGEIQATQISLPPGTHQLLLESLDDQGRVIQETIREVTIAAGDQQIISWRPFH
jgi:uncharacterized protein